MQNSHRLSSAPSQTNIEAAQDALFELTYRAAAGRHIEEKHCLFAMELGLPLREVTPSVGGYVRTYERGIVCCQSGEAFAVHGAIYAKYDALGREGSLLGFPLADEAAAARGGRASRFEGGVICWTAATGAHEVHGPILALWQRLGAEGSYLGWPVSDELPRGAGRVSFFEHGCIAWSEDGGAIDVPDLPEPAG